MGFKVKVITNKKGFFKKKLQQLEEKLGGGKRVTVGIPENTAPYPDGTSVAMVAAVHEFGTKIQVTDKMRGFFGAIGHPLRKSTTHITIPERSFLRTTMRENEKKYVSFLRKGIIRVVLGKTTGDIVAELLGQMAADDVKEKIEAIKEPPNSEMTIERKGSDNPLIDTGHLVRSVTHEVQDV